VGGQKTDVLKDRPHLNGEGESDVNIPYYESRQEE